MYDVVIVGSGYSGSVMAARLAGRGKVLLLERGREWKSGMFPQTLWGLIRQYRTRRNPLGLWEMRIGKGVGNALVSALGGASMVNYGITIQPPSYVFDDWPIPSKDMNVYYSRVREVLQPQKNPLGHTFGDQQFIDWIAPGSRADLENTIDWEKCTQCGHCAPGCNEDAKRSLDRTYLKLAREKGAEIWVERELVEFKKVHYPQEGYLLKIRNTGSPRQVTSLFTRQIVFCAGTFGTLDLLYRSRKDFPLSHRFGQNMSMNGDSLAFIYNTKHKLSGHLGAPISTSSHLYFQDQEKKKMLMVMSGRIPLSVMRYSAIAMALLSGVLGRGRRKTVEGDSFFSAWKRRLQDLWKSPQENGALSQSYMYKLDGQDGSGGRARFSDRSKTVIDWPGYMDDPLMKFAEKNLLEWAEKCGGKVIPNVATLPFMKGFGVHPLGGCAMGENFETGVVDSHGKIFHPQGGFYPGLRIADASIFPTSLGVPPSLTVSAMAERVAEDMIKEGI